MAEKVNETYNKVEQLFSEVRETLAANPNLGGNLIDIADYPLEDLGDISCAICSKTLAKAGIPTDTQLHKFVLENNAFLLLFRVLGSHLCLEHSDKLEELGRQRLRLLGTIESLLYASMVRFEHIDMQAKVTKERDYLLAWLDTLPQGMEKPNV